MTEQPVNCSLALSPVDLGVEVERLRELADAATPGPWSFYNGDLWVGATAEELALADRLTEEHNFSDEAEDIFDRAGHVFLGDPERPEDAEFIAAACNFARAALAAAVPADPPATRKVCVGCKTHGHVLGAFGPYCQVCCCTGPAPADPPGEPTRCQHGETGPHFPPPSLGCRFPRRCPGPAARPVEPWDAHRAEHEGYGTWPCAWNGSNECPIIRNPDAEFAARPVEAPTEDRR